MPQQQQPRSQQQSPAPSHHMSSQGSSQSQSQLAHLNQMSAQLQRQSSSGTIIFFYCSKCLCSDFYFKYRYDEMFRKFDGTVGCCASALCSNG